MDAMKTPGKWLDAEMNEQETADIMKVTALMGELSGETDGEVIGEKFSPYMNSFMHLMYLLIKGKLDLICLFAPNTDLRQQRTA